MDANKISNKAWPDFDPKLFMDTLKGFRGLDPQSALQQVADDAEWHIPGDPKFGGDIHRGKDGFQRFAALSLKFFPDGLERLWVRVWHSPGATILEQKVRGVAISGREYVNEYVFVFVHDRDGKVLQVKEYQDMLPLIECMQGWEE